MGVSAMPITGELVVSSILQQLRDQVPEVAKRYREDQDQNIVRPCFFVKEIMQTQDKLMGERYSRNCRIRITYLPELDDTRRDQACRAMGETLRGVFRILTLADGSGKVFGRNLEAEVTGGELLFTVDLPIHVVWPEDPLPKMQTLDPNVGVKG